MAASLNAASVVYSDCFVKCIIADTEAEMEKPLALKLKDTISGSAYRVSIEPALSAQISHAREKETPAILIAPNAKVLLDLDACVVDGHEVRLIKEGRWSDAILIVIDSVNGREADTSPTTGSGGVASGDAKFLAAVTSNSPKLAELASRTIVAIRGAGVDGELVEADKGRWINRPINTFTLKPQPRKGNLQFTLYGNPQSYDAKGFLLQDQNSYSRGWVRNNDDGVRLADLARQSHFRRKR
jgi:hypothetical protein